MNITLTGGPGATVARVALSAGETLTSEVGAMIAMDTAITVETTSRKQGSSGGGLLKGIKRMFSGESFFLNHFTSHGEGQEVVVGPALIGDVMHHRLSSGSLVVKDRAGSRRAPTSRSTRPGPVCRTRSSPERAPSG